MTTEEMIKVMKAYDEGKAIEWRYSTMTTKDTWYAVKEPVWNWFDYEYRIKPEKKPPTYRPYKDVYEMRDDIEKRRVAIQHPVFSGLWVKAKDKSKSVYDIEEMITAIDYNKSNITLGKNWTWTNLDTLFANYTYLDGTPFGVQE